MTAHPGAPSTTAPTWHLTAAELAGAIRAGDASPIDVVEQSLERIERLNPAVNAVCSIDVESARAAAAAAEAALDDGAETGPLHGVPVLVKDMIFTRGLRTTGGSLMYREFVPTVDDIAVERLRSAGAIVIGKTNTAEFGFSGNQTANQLFGATRNPHDLSRTPGGSSGGSAAAVAAGMAPVALGTDGGGSIRIPSSFCGTVGLKPTFGRVPLHPSCRDADWPGFSAWESLEHLGPITRDVRDAALLLDVLSGYDARDRLAVPTPPPTFAADLEAADVEDLRGLRIAVSADWGGEQALDADVRSAFDATIDLLAERGAMLSHDRPDTAGALEAFGWLVDLDFDVAAIGELCAGREEHLGPRLRELLTLERPAAAYSRAVRLRKSAYSAVAEFFQRYDVLVTPTTPVRAFPLDHNGPETVGGVASVDRVRAIVGFCCPFNLTGHPAVSVPWWGPGTTLPFGVQVVTPRFEESVALRVARSIELGNGYAAGRLANPDVP